MIDVSRFLPCDSYWYMATVYTSYPTGIERAFVHACQVAARLTRLGVPAYSPIAHSHPIATHGDIDPLDHKFWLTAQRPMMRAAHGLIVVRTFGWEKSAGIDEEIRFFKKADKPIEYLDPADF